MPNLAEAGALVALNATQLIVSGFTISRFFYAYFVCFEDV
jgi:hypothetical protein